MPVTNPFKKETLKAMQLYHSDGAVDIIAGSILLNFGLDFLNEAAYTSLFTWLPIILLTSIKNRYTMPRIGYETLGVDENKVKSWNTQTAAGLAIALVVISSIILGDPFGLESKLALPWEGDFRCLVFGVLGGLFLLAAAWRIPLQRFKIYAAVTFATSMICYFFLPVSAPIFISAAVILANGIRVMMSFSRQYPDPEKEPEVKPKKKVKGK